MNLGLLKCISTFENREINAYNKFFFYYEQNCASKCMRIKIFLCNKIYDKSHFLIKVLL